MYRCPVCERIMPSAMNVARHMIELGDKPHRDWINSRGMKYSELLTRQLQSFGSEGYRQLTEVIEKEAGIKE